MAIATATEKSLPVKLEKVPETQLHPLHDKPATSVSKHVNTLTLFLKTPDHLISPTGKLSHSFLSNLMRKDCLPSHKASLNTSRYGAHEGWIPLSIEQTNLGKYRMKEI